MRGGDFISRHNNQSGESERRDDKENETESRPRGRMEGIKDMVKGELRGGREDDGPATILLRAGGEARRIFAGGRLTNHRILCRMSQHRPLG